MTDFRRLAPFLEASTPAVIGVTGTSPFSVAAAALVETTDREATESGHPHGPFALEFRLEAAKKVSALRFKMARKVLGIRQRALAGRLGITPESLSRIVNCKAAASWHLEVALYREFLAEGLRNWISDWVSDEDREKFLEAAKSIDLACNAGMEYSGPAFGDRLEAAQIALAAVTGTEGWGTFWEQCGKYITPLPAYESSAQFLAGQVAQAKRDAHEEAAE